MAGINLIINGGFEDDFNNWYLDMDNRIIDDACTGAKAALVYGITQRDIQVAPATIYYLRFRYKFQPHKLIPIIRVTGTFGAFCTRDPDTGKWSYGNAILTETPTANGYTEVVVQFQSFSDLRPWRSTLQFENGGYPREVLTQFLLDDVYLSTTPPPLPPPPDRPNLLKYAIIALSMISSASLGYVIIRKRRK
jgi:hypothetical protein